MKNIVLILSFFVCQNIYSQLNIDSLWEVYNNEEESDSNRLMAMWYIAYDGYLYNNPDSSFLLAQQMYDFAKERGQLQFQGFALGTQGSACYYLGKLELAIECHEKALEIYKKLSNHGSVASSYNNIANIYREQGKQADAIDYFVKALRIYEKIGHKQAISTVLGNLGAVYSDMEDYENSQIWYRRALEIKKQTDDKLGLSLLLTGIGTRYLNAGIYDSAMFYQVEGLRIREEIDNKNGVAFSLKHIGEVYNAIGNLDSAMLYFNKSLSYFEELKMESGITDACFSIAEVFEKKGDSKNAMKFTIRAYQIANKRGFVDSKRDASYFLYKLYKKKGNFISALKMHEDYILMRDSIDKEANQKAIIKQQFKYEYEKKSIADSLKHNEEKKINNLKHKKEKEKQQVIITAVGAGLVLVILFLIFVFNRLRVTRKQKRVIEEQKQEVEKQKNVVEMAHDQLEEKNREILDSINYAKRIQSAILPPDKVVKEYLKDSFILYKPKDIVAGDFYWMEHKADIILFAAADCTGHGVPGAMVSVVCNNALNRSVREYGLTKPGKILDKVREIVIQEFEKSDEEVKDGMDIALCTLQGNKLQYAGANNPLWIIRNGEILETKANKQPIGKFDYPEPYTTHLVDLQKGDAIYIFSDGYIDQFGGEKGKKFKTKAFRELLLSIQNKPMEEQRLTIDKTFEIWKGNLEQIDDVCVIGVRI